MCYFVHRIIEIGTSKALLKVLPPRTLCVYFYILKMCTMENMRSVFYIKLTSAAVNKASNTSSLLSRKEYEQILNRLEELKLPDTKKAQKDYRLLRNCEILEVTIENIAVKKLQKKGTQLRFIRAEDVFDVIDAVHRASGHGGSNIVFKETSEKYANISKS